ncbi:hypothetical protein ADL22_07645 [Streptomyces sp. NRRL F-4489]|uniref:hypothetical protein n=1 Tax=Streptomyces sp. NRRL F-4489 TaxID=1609095 RepID=UPI000746684A|nr:hypothetical protein [Streptomyces sp. NRRL F-4489]KUL50120.1 hypothetical protein ADL22_07645 [Streptomyces sp. NRRL F-4489]
MAFGADELRVLRRALAHALQTTSPAVPPAPLGPDRAQDVQEYLRLAEAVDEAVREGARLRAFLLADLARYRAALPGAATGYLTRLQEALAAGHVPGPDDLAALRSLLARPATEAERKRRGALLRHCERLAEHSVRARLRALPGGRCGPVPDVPPGGRTTARPRPAGTGHRGGPDAASGPEPEREPRREPRPAPRREPAKPAPGPKGPRPDRPIPTPGEVFPPRRKPAPPPETRTA